METRISEVLMSHTVCQLPASASINIALRALQVGINLVSRIGGGADLVRRAQMEVSTEVPRVYFVDALGLPLYPDKVHLTTLAQARLGERLAAAYIKQLET